MSESIHNSYGNGASHGANPNIFNNFANVSISQNSPETLTFAVTVPILLANERNTRRIHEAITKMRDSLSDDSGRICDEIRRADSNQAERHRGLLDRLLGSDAAKPERRGRLIIFSLLLFLISGGIICWSSVSLGLGLEMSLKGYHMHSVSSDEKRMHERSLPYPVEQKPEETREAFLARCQSNVRTLRFHQNSVAFDWGYTETGIRLACASIAEMIVATALMLMSMLSLSMLHAADMVWGPANADAIFPETRRRLSLRIRRILRKFRGRAVPSRHNPD